MTNLILEDGTSDRFHRPSLSSLFKETTGVVRIATAYLTERQLLSPIASREIRILTSLTPFDVASGATSLESLNALLKKGVQCRTLPPRPRLHAKVYIFGNTAAVVTSANFTMNALDSNIEVGVRISEGETSNLIEWFDKLWDAADDITSKQLAKIRSETSAVRRELEKLKRKLKAKSQSFKPNVKKKKKGVFSDSLQEAFKSSTRFFVCNTDRRQGDRTRTGGFVLEEEMHNRGYATAWEDFKFDSHMEMVEPGNLIFMFAKGVGIIGVGVAEGSYEKLNPKDRGRVSHVHDTVEWRVPVRWLEWTDENGAFEWKSSNFTFWDVSDSKYDDFRADVIAHFLGAT